MFAVSRNLPCSTATLIHSSVKVRIELRIRPLPSVFKDWNARIIPEKRAPFHLMPSRRVLYVGADLALLASLKGTLKDCRVVRSPVAVARPLIESKIDYSLLLFDGELSELADFARSLPHRQHTPVFILPADEADAVETLTTVLCLLARAGRCPAKSHEATREGAEAASS
jgi:hypothetical protein